MPAHLLHACRRQADLVTDCCAGLRAQKLHEVALNAVGIVEIDDARFGTQGMEVLPGAVLTKKLASNLGVR